jgi:hypothetical protein
MMNALLDKDPTQWLALKMTEPMDPLPETIGEAVEILKPLIDRAINVAILKAKDGE